MTTPPRPSPEFVPGSSPEAGPLDRMLVYRSGAKVTMRCTSCSSPGAGSSYCKSFSGSLQLRTLVNLAEQHHREHHQGDAEPKLAECGLPVDVSIEDAGHSHFTGGGCDLEPVR